ncbi:TRAP transporter large permease [Chloroflexota bacterium]
MEQVTGIILIALLLVLIGSGVNIPISLCMIGLVGVMFIAGPSQGVAMLGIVPFRQVAVFNFAALPLFILMGEFAFHAGITRDLFETASKWVGRLPGGMGMAIFLATGAFGAVSGSSMAANVAMTRVAYPEMVRLNYDKGLTAGIISSAGAIAVLIPPSVLGIIYGMFTMTPIGKVLMAGVFPGIITGFLLGLVLLMIALVQPYRAPRGIKVSLKDKIASLKRVWSVLLLGGFVIGGIYWGIFTATEAAATGAFGALIIGLLLGRVTWSNFAGAFLRTARITTFIFFIMIGAFLFSRFLTLTEIGPTVTSWVGALPYPPLVILLGLLSVYLFLGAFMDGTSMLAVTISTVFPIVIGLGYDPVWFGIVFIMMVEIGSISPPIGLSVFAVKGVLGDEVETWTIFKWAFPFWLSYIGVIAFLIISPQIALWLPATMK